MIINFMISLQNMLKESTEHSKQKWWRSNFSKKLMNKQKIWPSEMEIIDLNSEVRKMFCLPSKTYASLGLVFTVIPSLSSPLEPMLFLGHLCFRNRFLKTKMNGETSEQEHNFLTQKFSCKQENSTRQPLREIPIIT